MTRLRQIFNKNTLVNCGDLLTVLYPSMCPPLLAITMWALTLTSKRALRTMAGSRAATSLLMLASSCARLLGLGE